MTDPLLLLVEDNPADAVLVTEAVEDAGPTWPRYRVRHVEDLRSAIAALDEELPTCVLLDLGLPDASGVAGVDRILLQHPQLPVVVLTGHGDPETADVALRRGAQEFLQKSADLSPELLARAVNHAVQRAAAAQALVESNQQLARFAGMVAHDLRSPLAVASGMLELLERRAGDQLDEPLHDLLDRSTRAIKRTTKLVTDLLDYARAKRPDDAREPVDLARAVRVAVEASGAATDGATVVVGEDLPTVIATEGAMVQVFQNLVANSLRYAHPDRPVAIRVDATRDGLDWRITVTDNGLGIPEDARERVFLEGERLDRGGDGLGLGLPAVRATVERYAGTVQAEAAPDGEGTTMVLTLPAILDTPHGG